MANAGCDTHHHHQAGFECGSEGKKGGERDPRFKIGHSPEFHRNLLLLKEKKKGEGRRDEEQAASFDLGFGAAGSCRAESKKKEKGGETKKK